MLYVYFISKNEWIPRAGCSFAGRVYFDVGREALACSPARIADGWDGFLDCLEGKDGKGGGEGCVFE